MSIDSLANQQARATWDHRACGTQSAEENAAAGSKAFFDLIAHRRYRQIDTWVPAALDFPGMAGKHVLEIGHGMGCDLVHAAKAGATVHGVDITANHHEIAGKHFAVNGLSADLRLCDASELPFASNSMDIVYSLGVLHHTDDTIRCIGEAYRVLKPGGTFIVGLYHFWSINHASLLLRHGLLRGGLRRLGYRRLLSLVEAGADGTTIAPLVKLYSRRQVRTILADFAQVDIAVAGLRSQFVQWLPAALHGWLERRFGWYVVAHATK
jgi:ubiquinone/menaquinone biosynthesis C-methylase UbiE